MNIERYKMETCCGKTALILKIDKTVTKEMLAKFVQMGFKEEAHFTKAGILYVTNSKFTITTPFGTTRLQIKCKSKNCDNDLASLEDAIRLM